MALVVAAFLASLASAIACENDCWRLAAAIQGPGAAADHGPSGHGAASHSHQGGLCGSAPTSLPVADGTWLALIDRDEVWGPGETSGLASQTWPPPRKKPKRQLA